MPSKVLPRLPVISNRRRLKYEPKEQLDEQLTSDRVSDAEVLSGDMRRTGSDLGETQLAIDACEKLEEVCNKLMW